MISGSVIAQDAVDKKAFPFEAPEPAIVAQVTDDDSFDDDSFAERLERALARRRQQPKLIEHSEPTLSSREI